MAIFLRDQKVRDINISEDKLRLIDKLFKERASSYNLSLGSNLDPDDTRQAFIYFTIRFDGKGYRVYKIEDLLQHFQQADEVERVIFTLETGESLLSNRRMGTVMELWLDKKDADSCFLSVTADDENFVNLAFAGIQDILGKCKNKNSWVRSYPTELFIQIVGVTFGFLISIWGAQQISLKLAIPNSFIISFAFFLLIFSNRVIVKSGV